MDSAFAGPIVPKAHYAPVNPDILNVPVDGIAASNNKENVKPSGHDEQHGLPAHTALGGIAKGNDARDFMPQLKPGYKPFNPALLSGFEQSAGKSRVGGSFNNLRMTESVWSTYAIAGSDVEQPVEDSRVREPVWGTSDNAGAVDEKPVDKRPAENARMTESVWSTYANEGSVDEKHAGNSRMRESVWSTYANAGSTSSNEQESNPFRRARLNRAFPLPSMSDDPALRLFRPANVVAPTPREQFATCLSIGDVASVGPSMGGGRPKPSAEVDPEDYGYVL